VRLVPLPLGLNYEQSFLKYFNVFLGLKTFKEEYAPFVKHIIGPSWFVQPFPPLEELEEVALAKWLAYLDPTEPAGKHSPLAWPWLQKSHCTP
jgi:hypothetical protein